MNRNSNLETQLSILIITKNEQSHIQNCLQSIHGWANEIIIADSHSTDNTLKIARKFKGVKIYLTPPGGNYSDWRNFVLQKATSSWVFYLDADERVTPKLKKEISRVLSPPRATSSASANDDKTKKPSPDQQPTNNQAPTAYAIPRRNFLLGRQMRHGGWAPGYVKRLFYKKALQGWQGQLHEEPLFTGNLGHLQNPLIHLQPDTLEPMLEKSIRWSAKEAQLLFDAHHPPAAWWRILRMGATTLWQRLILKRAFLDGTRGIILAVYQAFHTAIIYLRLWEIQHHQSPNQSKKATPPRLPKSG